LKNDETKKTHLLRSTDFASKGLYRESLGNNSQSVFKDCANLKLSGKTFDAKHLDNFLKSNYGLSSSPSRVDMTQSKN
jgi:hypothetical protein